MQSLTLTAPAKINLYLRVLSKRADGFHNIETIFEKIDFGDVITLGKRNSGIRLVCRHQDLRRDQQNNLAFRAAEALLQKVKYKNGVKITLVKKIPIAAGLGGGSSDAASVLLGLNRLLSLHLSQRQLLEIGRTLGADVNFFLLACSRALGRGRGDILTPLELKKRNWYVLVVPPLKISTRKMYQDPRMTLTKKPLNVKIILRALEKDDLTALNKYSYNSFEPILKTRYKQISQIEKALSSSGAYATLMSGSGPCVFGVTKTRKEAMRLRAQLRAKAKEKKWQVRITKTL